MITPILTEKSLSEAKKGKYTFRVSVGVTKYQIKKIVADTFSVHPVAVATMNYKKSTKKNNRGRYVSVPGFKKALVTLKKGEIISAFGVNEKKK